MKGLFSLDLGTKAYVQQWDQLVVEKGILYRKWTIIGNTSNYITKILVVPDGLKTKKLNGSHDAPSSAHLGIKRTLSRCRLKFYWVGMKKSVENCVNGFDKCQTRKTLKLRAGLP